MKTYRIEIKHRSGSRFWFECEAASLDDAERIAREWHPGSSIGHAHLTYAAKDVDAERECSR